VGVLLVLMVATLVLSFGSFRLAGLIVAVACLAVGLGLGGLWLFGYPFGFMAIVGTMGLVGVAINDAIVVLAGLRSDRQARRGDPTAMRGVVMRSTRHVVSTSLTTMAGFTPLVLDGGGFWPPLAVTIAGGVSGATLLALYFVPAGYRLLMAPAFGSAPKVADGRLDPRAEGRPWKNASTSTSTAPSVCGRWIRLCLITRGGLDRMHPATGPAGSRLPVRSGRMDAET
jgi:predicted RND superfamily exporter protein